MSVRAIIAVLSAGLIGVAATGPVAARQNPNAPAHDAELRVCRTHAEEIAPPGATIPDREAFCACYADGAVTAGLWRLERAESNLGQDVRQPDFDRTERLRAARSAEVAANCLRR